MSELLDKRIKFTRFKAMLICKMIEQGYQPCTGKDGLKHMKDSLHYDGLAVDIDLYKDGKYLSQSEDHRVFGEYWESLDPDCFWGGDGLKKDGLKNDGNHYSVTYQGKK